MCAGVCHHPVALRFHERTEVENGEAGEYQIRPSSERSRGQSGRGRPTDHLLAELLRQRQLIAVDAVVDHEPPADAVLLDGVQPIAGRACTIWVINA
jgi:hypothetical protein